MKKLAVFIIVAFAFSMAAVAQSEPSQGTTSPEMSQPSQQQPSQPQAAPDTNMGQTTPTSNGDTASVDKSGKEKQLRGCIQSQGGQYVLQSKKGKTVTLTGQDVSAHAGHEVSLKGTWESAATGTGVSSGSGSSEKSFNVASLEMISENCSGGKGNTGSMGTAPNNSAPANPNSEGSGSTSNPPQQ